jgi:heme A synthase
VAFVSKESHEHVVEWTFAGGWIVLLLIGVVVSWAMARRPPETYRGFVPLIGLVTAVAIIGTIMIGSAYFD